MSSSLNLVLLWVWRVVAFLTLPSLPALAMTRSMWGLSTQGWVRTRGAGPGVLLSCVYIMAPLACIVTTVTSGEDILELSVIIPLQHYAASVWEENEEGGIVSY